MTEGEHRWGNGAGTQQGLTSATLILRHRFMQCLIFILIFFEVLKLHDFYLKICEN